MSDNLSRRGFPETSPAALTAAGSAEPLRVTLSFVTEVDNPLLSYPERDWESIFRAQHRYDSHFHFMCAATPSIVLRVCGFSGSGKTTLLEQTVEGFLREPRR